MNTIEIIYQAAAKAGLLKTVTWVSKDGLRETREVEFRTADDAVFDNLLLAADTTLTYPSTYFKRAKRGDCFLVAGLMYDIRDIRIIQDGSETKVKVAKV
jgi:hypothetical protein